MKLVITILVTVGFLTSVQAAPAEKTKLYQVLNENETISECLATSWKYNWKTWYAAEFVFRATLLEAKWLEDANGQVVPGSLVKLVNRIARYSQTERSHRAERSALNECERNKKFVEAGGFSATEVRDAVERFLKN